MMIDKRAIGVFDSGYGGLTVLREFEKRLPEYDFIYLGDNARAPYGTRSFEVVYRYAWEAVRHLFSQGCPLVILACNTASAKALRTIQQQDLPQTADPSRRVLGVIRPSAEFVGTATRSRHVGVLATEGTVRSCSYPLEIAKLYPDITVVQEACPIWVPLVEAREADGPGADYFVRRHLEALLARDPQIDTIVLGCTHYPLLLNKIRQFIPPGVRLIDQGSVVAASLADYLARHPELATRITRGGSRQFYTTEMAAAFDERAGYFLGREIQSTRLETLG
jgi:glutamate racemase